MRKNQVCIFRPKKSPKNLQKILPRFLDFTNEFANRISDACVSRPDFLNISTPFTKNSKKYEDLPILKI